jgi:RNA polymerase sigma-70 factor, ECF subfamily
VAVTSSVEGAQARHTDLANANERESIFCRWTSDHLGLVLKVVRAYAADPADQDDLFQEILVQLWSSIPAFRNEAKETTWIYRVAFNTALAWRRTERRRRQRHRPLLPADIVAGSQAGPSPSSDAQELLARLYAAIRQLPGVDASLILMQLDGLSYCEMAGVLGISENHVGVKLTRIREQLAQLMKGAEDEL